ncbi:MAG: aminotransferase class I/II-fold pyridoxal phosphate-dependent enzyme [Marinobacter sp.]|nr:aminotransferase class I/II-fold pyridoxal phosphate-dependent enzyme [Marinobacter sp.]
MADKYTALATRVIHSGQGDHPHGSPYTPVYNTTTFRFANTAALEAVVEGRAQGNLYTRYGTNPTLQALEHTLADLEQAEAALAFTAGMAAISATLLTHGRAGIVCVGDLYGGTMEFLSHQCAALGIPVTWLLAGEQEQLPALLSQRPGQLVLLETPANPTLEILDIQVVAQQAHQHQALLLVDNTFASPVNQQPLTLGADLVVHSATKYLGGHSDLTAGAVMGSAALLKPLWSWRKNLGQTLAPETAALLSRSLRTLVVRVREHNRNAQQVAEVMAAHPRVKRVYYPGLADFPGHALAARQMRGFGGMLTLELAASRAETSAVADQLKLILLAPSLGGVESLATQPCTTSHHSLSPEERARRGISDSMLRLSVGLEDPADLIADIQQALAAVLADQ